MIILRLYNILAHVRGLAFKEIPCHLVRHAGRFHKSGLALGLPNSKSNRRSLS